MYKFKTELKKELLKGRTITYLADELGMTKQHITNVLNGKTTTNYLLASALSNNEVAKYFDKTK